MSFIWPEMLWFLLIVPLLIALYIRIQQRRKQFAVRYGSLSLVQAAAGKSPGFRRHIPAVLFLISITILITALARPQMVVSLPKMEGVVILAFDVSGSMAADDFAPSRMEAAKDVAREFVERQPTSVQVGIVAFSDSGFSVQPPTNDQEAILASIDRLEPQRGTSLATGINISLDTIGKMAGDVPEESEDFPSELLPTLTPVPPGTYSSAVVVLLTDGENNMNPNPLLAAQMAAERGVRIHTIGIGSAAGTVLEVDGFSVFTQLDEGLLQQISLMTDGAYYNAENETDLQSIYENIEPQFIMKREKTEVTSILSGISIIILLVGGMLSLLWFSRLP